MSAPFNPRLTAAEIILLAADDLTAAGTPEFSEWDLTVASWARDRHRFGLRGYGQKFPDHKRVMMEIMGRKPQNPVMRGLLTKVRPNTYRLSPLGRAEAVRLKNVGNAPATPQADLYPAVATVAHHPAFLQWQNDPDQPRKWAGAAAFLSAGGDPEADAAGCLGAVRRLVRDAMHWCSSHQVEFLTPRGRSPGEPIHVRDLSALNDFLQALEYRFPAQLELHSGGRQRVKA